MASNASGRLGSVYDLAICAADQVESIDQHEGDTDNHAYAEAILGDVGSGTAGPLVPVRASVTFVEEGPHQPAGRMQTASVCVCGPL